MQSGDLDSSGTLTEEEGAASLLDGVTSSVLDFLAGGADSSSSSSSMYSPKRDSVRS